MRTGKSQKNRSNKDVAVVSNKGGKQRQLLRLLDRVLDGATGWAGPSAFSLEQLEPRTFLSATLNAAGNYALYDSSNANPNDADLVVLNTGSSNASVNVAFTVDGAAGANDQIDLTIADPTPGAADNIVVNLVSTGPIHSVSFNGSAGDTLVLNITQASVTFTNATTLAGGVTFAGTAVDKGTAGDFDGAIANADVLTANGDIGGVTVDSDTIFRGGTISGVANIGAVAIQGNLDLTNAGAANFVVTPGTGSGVASVTVTGTSTLANKNVTLTMADNAGTAGPVSLSGAITLNDSGDLTIGTTNNGNLAAVSLGAVTNTSSNGSTVLIAPNGTGNFGGAVSIGAVDINGTNAGNTFTIGTASSTYSSVNLSGVRDRNTAAAAFTVQGGAITTLALGSSDYIAEDHGSLSFHFAGAAGGITGTSNLIVTQNDGITDAIALTVTGTTGATSFGSLVDRSSADVIGIQITLGTAPADTISSLTIGSVLATNTVANTPETNDGDIAVTMNGNLSGTLNITTVTLGDAVAGVGAAENPTFSVTAPDMTDLAFGGVWTINGTGAGVSISANAADSALTTVGGNAWDVNFSSNTGGGIAINVSDGMGAVTINSVDHLDRAHGFIQINANADAADSGPVGAFVIRTPGDDATNNIEWGDNSFLRATTGSTITVAGGVSGEFTVSGDTNAGSWGAVIIGQDSTGAAVDNSDFVGLLQAPDGITSLAVRGADSSIGAYSDTTTSAESIVGATINADTDAATETTLTGANQVAGSLGAVTVDGASRRHGVTDALFEAASFGDFEVKHGNFDGTIETIASQFIALPADVVTNVGSLGAFKIDDGGFSDNSSFLIDDGITSMTISGNANSIGAFASGVTVVIDANADDDTTGLGSLPSLTIDDNDATSNETLTLDINVGAGGLPVLNFFGGSGDGLDLAVASLGDVGTITVGGSTVFGAGNNDLTLTTYAGATFSANGISVTGLVATPNHNLDKIVVGSTIGAPTVISDPLSDLTQDAGNADIRVNGNINDIHVGGAIAGNGGVLDIAADNNGDNATAHDGDVDTVWAAVATNSTGTITNTTISAPLATVGSPLVQARSFTQSAALAGANWVESTKTLTETGAFTNYSFVPGDTITITGGTDVTTGTYTVASKVDSDSITLVQDITAGSSNLNNFDIAGVVGQTVDYSVGSTNSATTADVTMTFPGLTVAGVLPTVTVLKLLNVGATNDFGITTRVAGTTTNGLDGTDVYAVMDVDNIDVGSTAGAFNDTDFVNGVLNEQNIKNLIVEARLTSGIDVNNEPENAPNGTGLIDLINIEQGTANNPVIEVENLNGLILGARDVNGDGNLDAIDGDGSVASITFHLPAAIQVASTKTSSNVTLTTAGVSGTSFFFRSSAFATARNASLPGDPIRNLLFDQAIRVTPKAGGQTTTTVIAPSAASGGFSIDGDNASVNQAPVVDATGLAVSGFAIGAVSVTGADPGLEFTSSVVSINSTLTLGFVEVAGSLGSLTTTDATLGNNADPDLSNISVGFWVGTAGGPDGVFNARTNASFNPTGAAVLANSVIAPGINLSFETTGTLNDYIIEGGHATLGPVTLQGDWTGTAYVSGSVLGAIATTSPDTGAGDGASADISATFVVGDNFASSGSVQGSWTGAIFAGVLKINPVQATAIGANGYFFGATDNVDEGGVVATTGNNSSLILGAGRGSITAVGYTTANIESAWEFAGNVGPGGPGGATTNWDLFSGSVGNAGAAVTFSNTDVDGSTTVSTAQTLGPSIVAADSILLNLTAINAIGGGANMVAVKGDIGLAGSATTWQSADEQFLVPGTSQGNPSNITFGTIFTGGSFYTDINAGSTAGATSSAGAASNASLSISSIRVDQTLGRAGEGTTTFRADGNVALSGVDIGFGDAPGTLTGTTPNFNVGDGAADVSTGVAEGDESFLINVFAGLEGGFDPSNGVSPSEVTKSLTTETQGSITFGAISIDDNFGAFGQSVKNGILASGSITFGGAIKIGGVARNGSSGFSASDANDPGHLIDAGGSWLINVIGGISDGLQVLGGGGAAPTAPLTSNVAFSSTVAVDDDFGQVLTGAPGQALASNIISASGSVTFSGAVNVGVSFTTFTDPQSVVNGTVDYNHDGIPDALFGDINGDGVVDASDAARSVGDFNLDVAAGALADNATNVTAGLQFQPVFANINDISTSLPGGAMPQFGNNPAVSPNISINNLKVGVDLTGVNAYFIADDTNTPTIFEGDGNVNGNLIAAGSLTISASTIAGNLVGRDGTGGRTLIAGAGNISGGGVGIAGGVVTPNVLSVTGTVVGETIGGFASGEFVPLNDSANNPVDPNDVGPLRAGDVLTLGSAVINLTTGTLRGDLNGTVGSNGITLDEVLSGQEALADAAYLGRTTFATTADLTLNTTVAGRPYVSSQVVYDAAGNVINNNLGTLSANKTDGDATDISILSFGAVGGTFLAQDSATFNFIISNADAVTAIGTTEAAPGNPSLGTSASNVNTGTLLNVGNGRAGIPTANHIGNDITLAVTSNGWGQGGLDVAYELAGFDPFTRITGTAGASSGAPATALAMTPSTPNFFASFGAGNIGVVAGGTSLFAKDLDPTNGLNVGNLSFALIGAGQNLYGDLLAYNTITGRLGSATTDGTALFPNSHDADVVAGLSASDALFTPVAAGGLFQGGNATGKIDAGGTISHVDGSTVSPLTIAALGTLADATGNFSSTFQLISGSSDLATGTDLHAIVIGAGSVGGTIDAGDTQGTGATALGLPPSSDTTGSFFGAIHAGAGNDLDIFNTLDDQPDANIGATIRTAGSLDVSGTLANGDNGIYSEHDINVIDVGFGPNGGDIHGNIVAENNINEIEVWGDIGGTHTFVTATTTTDVADANPGVIFAGGTITLLVVGNPSAVPTASRHLGKSNSLYTTSFGILYADVLVGGFGGFDVNGNVIAASAPAIFIGGGVGPTTTIVVGAFSGGVTDFTVQLPSGSANYHFFDGKGLFTITGGTPAAFVDPASGQTPSTPGIGDVNIIAVKNTAGGGVDLDAEQITAPASIHQLIVGDKLEHLHVNDGSVGQIIVNDDFDILPLLTNIFAGLNFLPSAFPFFTDSLPGGGANPGAATATNFNDDKQPIDAGTINVDYNIGVTAAQAAIVGETLAQSLGTSLNASKTNYSIFVQGAIEDVTETTGTRSGLPITNTGSVTSETGSIGNVYAGRIGSTAPVSGTFNPSVDDVGVLVPEFEELGNTTKFVIVGFNRVGANDGQFTSVTFNNPVTNTNDTVFEPTSGFFTGANFTAQQDIGDLYAEGGGYGGTVTASRGSIGIVSVEESLTPKIVARENLGGLISRIGSLGAIGDDQLDVHGSIGLLQASENISVTAIAETGNIGIDLRPSGSYATAFVDTGSAGILSLAGNINVTLTAGNRVGNLETKIGDIDATIKANGGVSINPITLDYYDVADTNHDGVVDPTEAAAAALTPQIYDGIGNVFADIGNIIINATTATDLGVHQVAGTLVGGISAPIGTVSGSLNIGGDVGGVAGRDISGLDTTSVRGIVGLLRVNGSNGEVTTTNTRNIAANGSTTITSGGVNYIVSIGGGNAQVIYTVTDGVIFFNSITYNSDGSDTSKIQVDTQIAGTTTDSPVKAQIDDLIVNGNVNTVDVEANVEELTINGNFGLNNGILNVEGNLGSVDNDNDVDVDDNLGLFVSGDLGTSTGTNHNLTVHVGGTFGPVEVDGTDHLLSSFILDSVAKNTLGPGGTAAPQFTSFGSGAGTINAYLGAGIAHFVVDVNGEIRSIVLDGTTASNLVIVAADHAMTPQELLAQPDLIKKGISTEKIKGTTPNASNEVYETGSTSSAGRVLIDSITASGSKFNLKGLVVDGDVDNIILPGSISTVSVDGHLDKLQLTGSGTGITVNSAGRLLAALGLNTVNITTTDLDDAAELIDGGVSVTKLTVSGAVDIVKATKTVSTVLVQHNAGIVTSGGTMSNVFIGGSSISIGAQTMTNVQVTGSVGASVAVSSSGSLPGLGAAHGSDNNVTGFTIDQIADLLGISVGELSSVGDPGPVPVVILPPGSTSGSGSEDQPSATNLFYGGLEARTAKNVVVGGGISDTVITGAASGSDSLFVSTIDDAYMKIGKKVFTKVNGVIGQVIVDPSVIVVAGNEGSHLVL